MHLQGVPSVSGVSRRVRRIGLSGPPTGESQPFEEPNQQEPGEDSEDELRSAFNHARRARYEIYVTAISCLYALLYAQSSNLCSEALVDVVYKTRIYIQCSCLITPLL